MKRHITKQSIFILAVFLITILIGQISCQRAERRSDIKNSVLEASSDRNIVDSIFQADFAFLDSTLENKYATEYYPFDRVNEVTDFLVSLSGIEPTVDMSYIGWMGVNQEDVLKWKEWYNQNKHRLKWDEEKRKVILAPTKSSLKNKENIETLIQKAIDYDGLQLYLHPAVAERETLSITGASVPGDLKLYKFGRPVGIVSPDSQTENCLIFNEIEIGSDKAHLSFEYNIEGVRCNLVFELRESGWSIIEDKLIEK